MSEDYYTIEKPSTGEYKDRGSRFIGLAFPVDDLAAFKEQMAGVKKEHPKATHHCFAYRLGFDGLVFRVSDAGEPSGSAGRPILGQIDSRRLTNVLVVVVRYFGGTQLGIPGLINAYKTSASLALQLTPLIRKPVSVPYELHFDYSALNEILRVARQYQCTISNQQLGLFCSLRIDIPKERLEETLYRLNEMQAVTLQPFPAK